MKHQVLFSLKSNEKIFKTVAIVIGALLDILFIETALKIEDFGFR